MNLNSFFSLDSMNFFCVLYCLHVCIDVYTTSTRVIEVKILSILFDRRTPVYYKENFFDLFLRVHKFRFVMRYLYLYEHS